jgi:hypothetical protein
MRLVVLLFVLLCGCGVATKHPTVTTSPTPAPAREYALDMVSPEYSEDVATEATTVANTATVAKVSITAEKVAKQKKVKVIIAKKVADTVTDQLHTSTLGFVLPHTANIDETFSAKLLIQPEIEIAEMEKQFTGQGHVVTAKIVISNIATATLISEDFIITPTTPIEQAIAQTQATIWEWDLRAKSVGKHHIKLSVDAVITIDNKSTQYHLQTFEQDVTITITKQQQLTSWIKQYGQWLWTTLLLPLIMFVWKRFAKQNS